MPILLLLSTDAYLSTHRVTRGGLKNSIFNMYFFEPAFQLPFDFKPDAKEMKRFFPDFATRKGTPEPQFCKERNDTYSKVTFLTYLTMSSRSLENNSNVFEKFPFSV